uniref:RNase H domain-containing protein n=1 Tax=Macrostomum lignano TaxID=282301 RepID=A0A1I8ITF4_9PLAT
GWRAKAGAFLAAASLDTISRIPDASSRAPWSDWRAKAKIMVCEADTRKSSDAENLQLAGERKSEACQKPDVTIYSDGSVQELGGGSGVVIWKTDEPREQRAAPIIIKEPAGLPASSLQAELKAITRGLEWLQAHDQSALLVSDSQSGLMAIKGTGRNPLALRAQQLLEDICAQSRKVTLCCVPVHCGLTGNEAADEAAGAAAAFAQEGAGVLASVRRRLYAHAREEERDYYNAGGTSARSARAGEVAWRGTPGLNVGAEGDRETDKDTCPACGEEADTVEHVICSCPATERTRRQYGASELSWLNEDPDAALAYMYWGWYRASDQRRRQLPSRPDRGGTKGRKIALYANHFNFKFSDDLRVFMYDFEIQDCNKRTQNVRQKGKTFELRRTECEAVMRAFMGQFFPKINQYRYIYDGRRVAYFLDKLPGVSSESTFKKRVLLPKDSGEGENEYSVLVVESRTPTRHFGDISTYLTTEMGTADIPIDAIRVVDVLLKATFIEKSMVPIGSRALFFERSVPLGQREGELPWVMHQGLFASLRPQWSVRLNVDNTQVACYPSKNLADLLYEIGKSKRWRDDVWNRELSDKDRIILGKLVKMCRVEASHYKTKEGRNFTRKHTIFDLKRSPAASTITLDDGSTLTVQQYFKKQYGRDLQYPHMPCAKVSSNRNTLLPVELCTMMPYQKPPDKEGEIVSAIIRKAAVPAEQRKAEIEDRLKRLELNKSRYLAEFKVNIDVRMLQLWGRVLGSPAIGYAKNQSVKLDRGPGKWDARNAVFFETGQVQRWAFVNLDDRVRNDMPFFNMLTQQAGQNGIPLREDNCKYVKEGRPNHDLIDRMFREFQKDKIEFAMFVVNAFDKESYKTIKSLGDLKYGIITQAVLSKNVEGPRAPSPQTVGNILLKINGKLGGINWRLDQLARDLNAEGRAIVKEPMIVFGADVTHPAPTGDNSIRKSIAAVVASMDVNFTRYSAEFREQVSRKGTETNAVKEVIDDMKGAVKALLLKFYKRNGFKPTSIMFYRDGVSEGQFTEVLRHEVAAIQQACTEMATGNEYEPRITFIIVGKRHHTRLFPASRQDAVGKSGNCPAGTVVDTDIVHKREFNFYLLSHEGIQGTSKPSLYHVLWDDNKWSSDDLQLSPTTCATCTCAAPDRARTWQGEDSSPDASSVSSRQSAATDPASLRLEKIEPAYSRDDASDDTSSSSGGSSSDSFPGRHHGCIITADRVEERFRVDRRKLESLMLTSAGPTSAQEPLKLP